MNRWNLALPLLLHLACGGVPAEPPHARTPTRRASEPSSPPAPAPGSTTAPPVADPYPVPLDPAEIAPPSPTLQPRQFYIGPQELQYAAAALQASVQLELDNFTPTAYQYCRPAAPDGCPVPGADAETYKYFARDSSEFVINGRPFAFSLLPTRNEPFTFYIDDMRAVGIRLEVDGDDLVLGLDFEGDGVEIRSDCIRNAGCAFAGNQDRDFPRPRLNLRFSLSAAGGQVQFQLARAEVATGAASEDPQTVSDLNEAVENALLGEPIFRAFVSSALNAALLRFSDPERCTLQAISASGGWLYLNSLCW